MKLFKEINLLEQIDQFIRLKATGTPAQLAEKLGISEREVYRIVAELRSKDIKIAYCKQRCSYYYENDTFMKFQACVVENGKERKIHGGQNNFDFLENKFQTARFWQWAGSSL
jgi:DNA-binding transcriptional regulator GbsR (MarR family)